jgi:hypothetical protein
LSRRPSNASARQPIARGVDYRLGIELAAPAAITACAALAEMRFETAELEID